jgi:hypothetical protein
MRWNRQFKLGTEPDWSKSCKEKDNKLISFVVNGSFSQGRVHNEHIEISFEIEGPVFWISEPLVLRYYPPCRLFWSDRKEGMGESTDPSELAFETSHCHYETRADGVRTLKLTVIHFHQKDCTELIQGVGIERNSSILQQGSHLSIHLWLYSPFLGLGRCFSFLIFLHCR